jgi:selenide,water dikinase
MSPEGLVKALQHLPAADPSKLLVGPSTLDDAGVVRLTDELALVQTVDFFPPIVDEPRAYGQIAAANSLSDVYAMGGTPHSCLSVVGWPVTLAPELLGEILLGGQDKIDEAGAVLAGGHTISDTEIKYGLSVTGLIHPDRIMSNAGARPGDVLVLTKRLGMGAISTAIGKRKVRDDVIQPAMQQMATLNKGASEAALELGLRCATDVTGFGLMGHLSEVAIASDVSIDIDAHALPAQDGAMDCISRGLASGGWKRNLSFLEKDLEIEKSVPIELQKLAFDAETSGGLVLAVAEDRVDALVDLLVAKETLAPS